MKSNLDNCDNKVQRASHRRLPMSTKKIYRKKRTLQNYSDQNYKPSQWNSIEVFENYEVITGVYYALRFSE